MDQLPQELIDEICGHLPKADLRNVLLLTGKFRYAAERLSGAFTEFTINEFSADTFMQRYSGHRLLYLREVVFRPSLSPLLNDYYDLEDHCRENLDQLREKDEQFSNQISTLFNILQVVEEQAGEKHAPGRYRLAVHQPTREVLSEGCQHYIYVSWRIHLLRVTELPRIHSVRTLVVHDNDEEQPRLDGRIPIDLATRLPNLEFFDIRTGGYEWRPLYIHGDGDRDKPEEQPDNYYEHDWEGPRRDSRRDFAVAATSCIAQLPASLRRASLDFLNSLDRSTDIDHFMALPDLVGPLQKDVFSTSLRLLSVNLRQLRIRAMVDDSLFWSADNATPFGPTLEVLDVMFHPARPDGKWYFEGPGGEGRDAVGYLVTEAYYPPLEMTKTDYGMHKLDSERHQGCWSSFNCQFRISPNDTNLRPLLEGFAKAVTQMRSLKKALLWSPMRWYEDDEDDDDAIFPKYELGDSYHREWCTGYDDLAWGIGYKSASVDTCRQLEWVVSQWRPDPELHDIFQQIGRTQHGDELEELWLQDLFEDSPLYRGQFEDFMSRHYEGCIAVQC